VLPPMLADHPALDFVGTVAERTTTHDDRLTTPAALGEWLAVAGVLDEQPNATADDLAAAVRLREALYSLLRAATEDGPEENTEEAAGAPFPRDALAVVNEAAAGPACTLRLSADGHVERMGTVPAALAHIARTGIELIGGPDRARLRWCADATCTHPFLDRSRGRRRRWCGMAGCGDRAKARAYRARHRDPDSTS
jgi:predicted RNA-binding Zn ribbon-like protein